MKSAKSVSLFIGLFFVIIISNQVYAIEYFAPPLKQTSQGIKPLEVTCAEGLELVLKQSNGQPACIRPSSVSKLIERGWAVHVLPDYQKGDNNSEIFEQGKYKVQASAIEYFDGINGYLAIPESGKGLPGIVMIHEWWGLNDNIKDMAEKLASHGYVVLAVDLYGTEAATTTDEARALMSSYDQKRGTENLKAAAEFLRKNYNAAKMGSIGWCFGGGQSLNLSINDNLDATVIYYGQLVTDPDQLSHITWPILGIFAENDAGIPPQKVLEFESELGEIGIENDITIYPGVDHAFANPSGQRYAPEEARDAWQKTLDFFAVNLS